MEKNFPRRLGALSAIFEFVDDFFGKEKLENSEKWIIDFVLEELFTNAVRHNPTGRSDIHIKLSRKNDELTGVLTDFDSEPFDVTRLEPPDISAPLRQRRSGGLGVHLVKSLVDDISYEYADQKSTLTIRKILR